MKIGRLSEEEAKQSPQMLDVEDPFYHEPERHPALKVVTARPFNAETPLALTGEQFITPTELHFVRNHHPVPRINIDTYVLHLEGLCLTKPATLTIQDLRTLFPQVEVEVTIQCAGNRRSGLHAVKETQGLLWDIGTISTARWKGARLADVLLAYGVSLDCGAQHVWFEAADYPFDASIPLARALDRNKDVILAYEMNGGEIPLDHGFPLRVVVPGVAGVRSVKWLKSIRISMEESKSNWQRGLPYRGVFYKEDFQHVRPQDHGAVNELPVQSAICQPTSGAEVSADEPLTIKGYAWSGGGRAIERVDVCAMGERRGHKCCYKATLVQKASAQDGKAWAWTLFEADLLLPRGHKGPLEILCKAMDSSFNSQPST
eukprot:g670.t1